MSHPRLILAVDDSALSANSSINCCQKRMSWRRVRDVMSGTVRRGHHVFRSKDTLRQARNTAEEKMFDGEVSYNDLTIQFIGASGLPKMDVVGSADPYFIADLDGQLSIV